MVMTFDRAVPVSFALNSSLHFGYDGFYLDSLHPKSLNLLLFFSAVYNFDGRVQNGLQLEIGETVQILEICSLHSGGK